MAQTGDLPEIEVWCKAEIKDERQSPQATDDPRKPQTPSPHVKPHETNKRESYHPEWQMAPADDPTSLSDGFRLH